MNRSSLYLILSAGILISFGLLMIFNTTSAGIIDRSLQVSTHTALLKQCFYGLIGLLCGAAVYVWGYEKIIRLSPILLFVGTLCLILLFVPGFGQTINGARRWLNLFGFSFQPSECIKLLIPAYFIRWFLKQKGTIELIPFLKALGTISIPIALILLEPDNGTAIILLSLVVALCFLTRIPFKFWGAPLLGLMIVGGVAGYQMPHVRSRLQVYFHPELDLKGKGHQPHQAKIAAGSGQLFGRGLGESLQKLNYLPEARNDYIAAIYAEETGFIGVLGLIALYMIFAYAGFLIAIRATDRSAFLFAAILTFLISIQAFLNLGIVSGLLPSKGMALPFFSQGGTSLIVNLAALFLLLDIARKSKKGALHGL